MKVASQVALEADVNVKQSFFVPFKSWRTISGTAPVVAPELVCLLTPNAVVATVQETIPKLLFLGSAQRPVPHLFGRQCRETGNPSLTGQVLLPADFPRSPCTIPLGQRTCRTGALPAHTNISVKFKS